MRDMGPYKTRDEAIVAAVRSIGHKGGTLTIHKGRCSAGRDEDCDCTPRVIEVPRK